MGLFYYLAEDGKTPIECWSLREAPAQPEDFGRVGDDHMGEFRVSTVFTYVNRNYASPTPPILWETLVFKDEHPLEGEVYSSFEAALEGHKAMVNKYKKIC